MSSNPIPMTSKKNAIIVPLLLLALLMLSPFAASRVEATQPTTLYSRWTGSPPKIDGQFSSSDAWRDPQLELLPPEFPVHTFVYIMNDENNLYMMVDASSGDYSEEPRDHCTIAFHNPADGAVFSRTIFGRDPGAVMPDFEAMSGFGASPNSARNHRMYEFRVSMRIVTVTTTKAGWIHFASPPTVVDSLPYDDNGGQPRVNTWPPNADPYVYDTWGIIILAIPPVGGEIVPLSGLASTIPWIALGIIALTIGSATLSRRKNYSSI